LVAIKFDRLVAGSYLQDSEALGCYWGYNPPCAMAAWFKPTTLAYSSQVVIQFIRAQQTARYFAAGVRSNGAMRVDWRGSSADTTNQVTLNAWNHLVVDVDDDGNYRGVLNGDYANRASGTNSLTDPFMNTAVIGASLGGVDILDQGLVGHVSFWREDGGTTAVLTEGDIAMLAAGYEVVRPELQTCVARLFEVQADIHPRWQNNTPSSSLATIQPQNTPTTVGDMPPMIWPTSGTVATPEGTAPPVTATLVRQLRATHRRVASRVHSRVN